jgi:hypothetical protein
MAFEIFTVESWPLIVAGKPLISIPPFIVVAFACTILLGGIFSFVGFLYLSGMPSLRGIMSPVEHDNQFVIREKD